MFRMDEIVIFEAYMNPPPNCYVMKMIYVFRHAYKRLSNWIEFNSASTYKDYSELIGTCALKPP